MLGRFVDLSPLKRVVGLSNDVFFVDYLCSNKSFFYQFDFIEITALSQSCGQLVPSPQFWGILLDLEHLIPYMSLL